ncbi:hypothetical protein [Archangium sp.]|uniref:hypothetical protein n=1 Tax=Archangium sp. TaxID=1872627 RepID=UPI002ED77CB7
MSPKHPLLCVALLCLGVLSACALRPYYRQVLPPEVARSKGAGVEQVMLRVVEPDTGRPIPGARVLLTTGRGRVNVASDAEGLLRLPVSSELFAENPLVEVLLPKGVAGYAFQPVAPESEAVQPPASEPGTQPQSEPAPQPTTEPSPQPVTEPGAQQPPRG